MNYEQRLQNVTVLGAAGKMGSGILLLTAVEMADLSLQPENKGKVFILNAMDVSDEALSGLMAYVGVQVQKIAEKKTNQLRKLYEDREDLVENGEIIDQYIKDVLNVIRPVNNLEAAYSSTMVFEAIKEDPALKVKIFKQIKEHSTVDPWFFSNTSSIPLTKLDVDADLGGKIIGFHFYNPPAVQKLVEIIRADGTLDEVNEFALTYAKRLRKVVVPSNDFAGFIGNGHFMRDAIHGIHEAEYLSKEMSLAEGIYAVNKVSQEYLVRPMGIFQLIDYVGIDVCQYIMSVMNPYLDNEDLHANLLDKMIEAGVRGGQYSSGAQKDGFLKYEKGRPVAIYDINKKEYVAIDGFAAQVDEKLGAAPASMKPWKAVNFSKTKATILETIFEEMNGMETMGAEMAKAYNTRSNEIGKQLVADGVANNDDDVNTVMLTGFFHAYGPINTYLK